MKFYKIIITFFVVTTINIFAQGTGSYGISNSRSAAMGGSNAILSQGIYSFNVNPALLALPQDHNVELSVVAPVPNFSGMINNDFFTWGNYNYYFGGVKSTNGKIIGRDLTAVDKSNFKSLFANGSNFNTFVSLNLISLSFNAADLGSFGFAITDFGGENGTIPKDLVDLAVDGNEIGRVYNLNDGNFKASYLREYSFTYARDLTRIFDSGFLSFSGGLSVKIVKGFAYLNAQPPKASIETLTDNSIKLNSDITADIALSPDFGIDWGIDNSTKNRTSNISPFPTPAGSGVGFSVGFAAQIDSVWGIGISLTDIGSVTWNRETVRYSSFGSFLVTSVTDSTQTNSLTDSLKFKGSYTSGFTSKLPGTFRIGVSLQLDQLLNGNFPGKMLMVFGYNQGINNEPFNTTNPEFSVGFEWKLFDLLPIRSGLAFGKLHNVRWSLGFGLDFGLLEMNFASTNFSNIIQGNKANGIDFSFGSRWKF